jgi:hypothetical protein
MRPYTTNEKLKISAGAVASLVIGGMGCRAGPRISIRAIKQRPPTEAALLFPDVELVSPFVVRSFF